MKETFFVIILFIIASPRAEVPLVPTTDLDLSRQCRTLLEDRNHKTKFKYSLDALLLRNRNLQGTAPTEKETLHRNLKTSEALLEQKIELASLRIKTMEEDLIRRGCPGLERAALGSQN